jgi:hypothetical protein
MEPAAIEAKPKKCLRFMPEVCQEARPSFGTNGRFQQNQTGILPGGLSDKSRLIARGEAPRSLRMCLDM